jgi:hypothetical protein
VNAPLIGLIGKKRTGKDTFAAVLVEKFGFQRVALADPLREAVYRLNPIVGTFPLQHEGIVRVREWRLQEVIDELGWEKAKDYVPEVRAQLQRFGSDAIREIDDQFWIRAAFARINALRKAGTPVVVTDVRFPNEADAIHYANGFLVRILRDLPDDGDSHASETALDDYAANVVLHNNNEVEDLQYLAESIGRDVTRMFDTYGRYYL